MSDFTVRLDGAIFVDGKQVGHVARDEQLEPHELGAWRAEVGEPGDVDHRIIYARTRREAIARVMEGRE